MKKYSLHVVLLAGFLAILLILAGCSRKPLIPICQNAAPVFTDDLDRESLKKAVQRNIAYLQTQPQESNISFAERTIPLKHLTASLAYFLDILQSDPSPEELDVLVKKNFNIYQASGLRGFNPWRKVLVTAYFQPVFAGSLKRQTPFLYPLYSPPDDLVIVPSTNGSPTTFHRLEQGVRVAYWTRKEIEKENKATGYEIVWLKDPFDVFVLHVQGSGLIRLQDGTVKGVHYAAKNGQPYHSIGKYMVDTDRITLEEASLKTIREYIASHPEEREEILHQNPSFIFFGWTETRGAIGNLGKELIAGRSIAVDQSCFPAGSLAFLDTRKPAQVDEQQVEWSPLQRFVLVQDTGSAIKGPGRVDLFWGTGTKAGFEAGHMKEKGTLYFLVLKDEILQLSQH